MVFPDYIHNLIYHFTTLQVLYAFAVSIFYKPEEEPFGFYQYIGITLSDYTVTQGFLKINMGNYINLTKQIIQNADFWISFTMIIDKDCGAS